MAIEYRWAESQIDRLPALAAELVRRQVAVIAASGGSLAALAAKAATTTIPIVFNVAEDPVRLGLVASLARPGGNLTGINFFSGELVAKRLELLRELVPSGHSRGRARQSGQCCQCRDHDERRGGGGPRHGAANPGPQRQHQPRDQCGLRNLVRERPDALFVGGDAFFTSRRVQMAHLAARHAIPAIIFSRVNMPKPAG